jgi:hypothetical protein
MVGSMDFNSMDEHLQLARTALKSLRRLIVYGYSDFTKSTESMVFF